MEDQRMGAKSEPLETTFNSFTFVAKLLFLTAPTPCGANIVPPWL
jgi:hypothetical protein